MPGGFPAKNPDPALRGTGGLPAAAPRKARRETDNNFSFSFLVESSVVTGKSKARNGQIIEKNIINNDSILVKYQDDSVHNLFNTSC